MSSKNAVDFITDCLFHKEHPRLLSARAAEEEIRRHNVSISRRTAERDDSEESSGGRLDSSIRPQATPAYLR
jgi:hypothetical protein